MTNSVNAKVLLITPNPAEAALIGKVLAEVKGVPFELQRVRTLPEGLERLSQSGIDVVLLNLSLIRGESIPAFALLSAAVPRVPVVALGGPDDEGMARQAVQHGADDYLLTDYINTHTLSQALRNAIKRKEIEDALFVERDRAQVTLNSIGDAVLSTDISGNITYLNPVAEKMTGWTRAEASGRPLTEVFQIIEGDTRAVALNPMALAIKENRAVGLSADCVLIRRDGTERAIEDSASPIHDRTGRVAGAVIVFHDVSESRAMQVKMSHLALHDPLTDLPNRTLLHDRITQAITVTRRHNSQFAVLFLDVDRFKLINDSLGHAIGDQLLRSIATRLLACVRGADTVCRLGGDEFVVLLSEVEHARDAFIVADNILTALAVPYNIPPHVVTMTVSVGTSVCPDDGLDADTLIDNADTALYHAKDSGRNNSKFFTQDMNVRAVDQRSLEAALRVALNRREFALQYQPIVSLATGVITGAEALLRWHHPNQGTILPGLFVPIAEECRLIVPIGQWVLREAMQAGPGVAARRRRDRSFGGQYLRR